MSLLPWCAIVETPRRRQARYNSTTGSAMRPRRDSTPIPKPHPAPFSPNQRKLEPIFPSPANSTHITTRRPQHIIWKHFLAEQAFRGLVARSHLWKCFSTFFLFLSFSLVVFCSLRTVFIPAHNNNNSSSLLMASIFTLTNSHYNACAFFFYSSRPPIGTVCVTVLLLPQLGGTVSAAPSSGTVERRAEHSPRSGPAAKSTVSAFSVQQTANGSVVGRRSCPQKRLALFVGCYILLAQIIHTLKTASVSGLRCALNLQSCRISIAMKKYLYTRAVRKA